VRLLSVPDEIPQMDRFNIPEAQADKKPFVFLGLNRGFRLEAGGIIGEGARLSRPRESTLCEQSLSLRWDSE
jgi:hypothetical protein